MGPTIYLPPAEWMALFASVFISVTGGIWALFRLRAGDKASLARLVKDAVDSINDRLDRLTDKVGQQNGRVTKTEVRVEELQADKNDMFASLNEIRDFLLSSKAGLRTKRRKEL